MSTAPNEPTADPQSTSRRDVLRSAAGALALGLGAPLHALAADEDDWRVYGKVTWYAGEKPVHKDEVPEEVARVLLDERSRLFIKIELPKEAEDERAEEIEVTYALRRVE